MKPSSLSADASADLTAFAELIDAPVCCSLMGLGCIPASHPLCIGNIGMHGGYETGMATSNCDLIIACGARFSDRVAGDREKFGEQAKIVQLEIDDKEINKNVKVDEYVLGDIKEILVALSEGLDEQKHPQSRVEERSRVILFTDTDDELAAHTHEYVDKTERNGNYHQALSQE